MARTRVSKGLSIQQIMRMPKSEFEKYTPTEQREITSRLISAANKRLKTLERNDIVNPATLRVEMSGGKLSVRGKTGEALQKEFDRSRTFLRSSFSLKSKWNRYVEKLEKSLSDKIEEEIADTEDNDTNDEGEAVVEDAKAKRLNVIGLSFSYYDLLKDTSPNISNIADKYKTTGHIAELVEKGIDFKDIISNTMNWLHAEYLKEQKRYREQSTQLGTLIDGIPDRFRR